MSVKKFPKKDRETEIKKPINFNSALSDDHAIHSLLKQRTIDTMLGHQNAKHKGKIEISHRTYVSLLNELDSNIDHIINTFQHQNSVSKENLISNNSDLCFEALDYLENIRNLLSNVYLTSFYKTRIELLKVIENFDLCVEKFELKSEKSQTFFKIRELTAKFCKLCLSLEEKPIRKRKGIKDQLLRILKDLERIFSPDHIFQKKKYLKIQDNLVTKLNQFRVKQKTTKVSGKYFISDPFGKEFSGYILTLKNTYDLIDSH